MEWQLKLGRLLFKYRSFTPLPPILLVVILFRPIDLRRYETLVTLIGLSISLLGETIRIIAVGWSSPGTSGRESYLKADVLNTGGIYSLARNPLYIGNFFIFSGLLIVFANPFALLIFAFFLILQYRFIILAEEDYLEKEYGQAYEDYCRRVRRIIPNFKNYQENRHPFDLKKVILKENDSLFNLLLMFLLILLYKERILSGRITHPIPYIVCGGLLVLLYAIVKIIKKRKKASRFFEWNL